MKWTTPTDIKGQLVRLWERGVLARSVLTEEKIFPLRLPIKQPSSTEITDCFDAVRHWAAQLAAMSRVRIEWRKIRHRVHGLQRIPAQAWVDTMDDAIALLNKHREFGQLVQLVQQTDQNQPCLLPWLTKRPLQAIALYDVWPQLLSVAHWMSEHPCPNVYLRQVDIAGIHSKFIEAHRTTLAEFFDLVLPSEAIQKEYAGLAQFNRRYGFLDKPVLIRFRLLDTKLKLLPCSVAYPDITCDAESFACLKTDIQTIFITENETNFLSFPAFDNAIAIFGRGYGWEMLAKAHWLNHCRIYYWGDIDTHGFKILDQLRSHFKHVISFLMDRDTLIRHQAFWGTEPKPIRHDLSRLTASERDLFDDLRDNRIQNNLRLEQEHVGFEWLLAKLSSIKPKNGS